MKDYYKIIPRSLCFIIKGDEVLLLKGHPNKIHWAGQYNALGGHIEFQEDIFKSSIREIKEESGITISKKNIFLKGVIHVKTYFNENVLMFIFLSKVKSSKFVNSEEGTLEWKKLKDIKNIKNIAPDIKIILSAILKMEKGCILSGISSYDKQKKLKNIKFRIYDK